MIAAVLYPVIPITADKKNPIRNTGTIGLEARIAGFDFLVGVHVHPLGQISLGGFSPKVKEYSSSVW